jgi:5-methyltetrahydropteroyltriglutamate--homocysteine methyltransferase
MPRPAWLVDDWYSIAANWRLSGTALSEGFDDATRLALADQEAAGIDIVCDGEQRRPTHHTYFLSHLDGVDFTTLKPKAMRGPQEYDRRSARSRAGIGPGALHDRRFSAFSAD